MKRIVVLLCLLSVLWPGTAQTFIRSLPTSTNLTSATKVPVDDATYGTRAVTLQNLLASTATNATLLAAITNVVEDTATSLLANKLNTTNGTAVNLTGSFTNATLNGNTVANGKMAVNTAVDVAALKVYSEDPSAEAETFRAYAEFTLTSDIGRRWGSYEAAHVTLAGYNITDRFVQDNSSTLFRGAGGINYTMQFSGRPEIDTPASLSVTNGYVFYGNIVNSSTAGGKYINPYHGYFLYSGAGTNENPGYLLFADITTPFTGRATSLDMRMAAGTGKFNIYQSGTASNYIAGPIGMYANVTMVGTQVLGDTGSAAAPSYAFYNGNEDTGFYRPGNKAVGISTAGTARWQVNSSGHTLWATDNTLDIGANGATRPRSIYAGTSVMSGGDLGVGTAGEILFTSEGRIGFSTDGVAYLRNNANSASASLTHRLPISSRTLAYTILATEGATVFNNNGATNQVTLTLPSSPTSGLHYRVHCLDTDGIVLAATNSHTIRIRGSTSASNGYVSSTTVNAALTVVWDGSAWNVIDSEGPWTLDGTLTPIVASSIELGHATANTLSATNGTLYVEGNAVPSPASPSTGQIIVYTNSAWTAMTPGASGIGGSTGSTDNRLLRADGTGGATLQNSAVVVDDFTSSTANNVAIKVDDGSTANIAAVITPKGTGAFIVGPKPDGTGTGGNARGQYAVDLQSWRDFAGAVASGNSSVAVGTRNTASALYSVAIGYNCWGAAQGAVAVGEGNTASGLDSFASGSTSTASGAYSFAHGFYAQAPNRGQFSISGGNGGSSGGSQSCIATVYRNTTATTQVVLSPDGSSGTLALPNNTAWTFEAKVTGITSAAATVYSYILTGVITRGANAASTAMPAAVTKVVVFESNAAADADAVADTTNGALSIRVTPFDTTATRWSATVQFNQVTF